MVEVMCIALAIYFESRGEPLLGQVGVANTIINRIESPYFPNTACDVVKQGRYWNNHPVRNQCHYSFWCDGKPEQIDDEKAYTLALSIAINADRLYDVTNGATYFHREDISPYWVSSMATSLKIGRHIFYVD